MIKYGITVGNTTTEFATRELAEASNLNGEIFEIVEIAPSIFISTEEKLLQDVAFGKTLIYNFLLENKNIDREFTLEENLTLLNKFASIETLARLGDIKTVLVMVQLVEIDEIFTKERKDKFLETINSYLNG